MRKRRFQPKKDAVRIFKAGLGAVQAKSAVDKILKLRGSVLRIREFVYHLDRFRRIYVIGTGKATAGMAQAIESILGDRITQGWINVKTGHILPLHIIRQQEAGHPLPDRRGERGAEEIIKIAETAEEEDLVICLLSGGGSALLPAPVEGINFSELKNVNRLLLECGASIHEINVIRKHLSRLKGGRLAKVVHPATLLSLIISDVVGDDPGTIASGPTVPDPSTFGEGWAILERYGLLDKITFSIRQHFKRGMAGGIPETPESGDPIFEKVKNIVVASNQAALQAAAQQAKTLGYHSYILSSALEGDNRQVARFHAAIVKKVLNSGRPVKPPACLLSGGETTVRVTGKGKGGRNQEFVLVAGLELRDCKEVTILSAGTDGTDGPTDAAGAVINSTVWVQARRQGLNAIKYLENNDTYNFFKPLDALLFTGPTGTNVMDLRILLIV